MGGYHERELDVTTRPVTTFETPLGRMKLTRLPQGATSSVALYQVQMTWILQEELLECLGGFIDDGGKKGLRSLYSQETLPENPSIRRFIWEYAITLERFLLRIEVAGLTISESKFACGVPALDIVGHAASFKGRTISKQNTNKIQNWPAPLNKKEIRGFLGFSAYVRMFIENFSQVASPLRRLTRGDVDWVWDQKCEEAFHKLRRIVGEEITLKKLEYDKIEGKIKLAVDSSYTPAGAVLTQEEKEGKDTPVLYESKNVFKIGTKILTTQMGTLWSCMNSQEASKITLGTTFLITG
ncbi:hypothetical protein O181_024587 [Austropuccinia psidii MF-1]|uniref:Reverse transcriptase/retrotransposon-derived protein RNase H-like domain-containing protein n=1 Tax=Austropuccinia psidii MF-1 TaxID=1389203 RepID=A0A9Q3GZ40_9BASI|nr:hypothetical protein [Austropuccinia psidii MF-1]